MYDLFDTVIKNVKIIDGTGIPWFAGDVGIQNGKIGFVGHIGEYRSVETIDGDGRILCPGFIDIHTHCDFMFFSDPYALSRIMQGVTTVAIGQCGISPAPVTEEHVKMMGSYTSFIQGGAHPMWTWRSFADWLSVLDSLRPGVNVFSYVGHGTIKLNVTGSENRNPTGEEIAQMQDLLRSALEEGAFGMSSGLIYPPGSFASIEEIIAVAEPLREYNALYLSHVRNEASGLPDAVAEILLLAEQLHVPVQVHHLKSMGNQNWGLTGEVLDMMEEARKHGVDVTAEVYPYTATSTTLRTMLPGWVREKGRKGIAEMLEDREIRDRIAREIKANAHGEDRISSCGGPEGIVVLDTPETPELNGKNLAEASSILGLDPIETVLEIIMHNRGEDACCFFCLDEKEVASVLASPLVMVGSDSLLPASGSTCHPRTYGTFPRILDKYVMKEGLLSIEEAVRKMTGFPAARAGLLSKGLVREGMDADLILFDPAKIKEKASFAEPTNYAAGIDEMFINGKRIISGGEPTGVRAGKVLRRGKR